MGVRPPGHRRQHVCFGGRGRVRVPPDLSHSPPSRTSARSRRSCSRRRASKETTPATLHAAPPSRRRRWRRRRWGLSPATRDMVSTLCEAGWLYKRVMASSRRTRVRVWYGRGHGRGGRGGAPTASGRGRRGGLLAQAFCASLEEDLSDYYRLIAVLERCRPTGRDRCRPCRRPLSSSSKSTFAATCGQHANFPRRGSAAWRAAGRQPLHGARAARPPDAAATAGLGPGAIERLVMAILATAWAGSACISRAA